MMRIFGIYVVLFAVVLMSGCSKKEISQKNSDESVVSSSEAKSVQDTTVKISSEADEPNTGFTPFHVYTEKSSSKNHYTASGFMPDGACVRLDNGWQKDCQSGRSCIRVEYDVPCSLKGQKWGGIYWLNPPNNWGRRKGGYNLEGATHLSFWAKGEKGGEQIQEFTVGGIEGTYPDSDKIFIGPVILSAEWKQYSIDLRGKDLSYISGGFSWSTETDVNPEECIFYLDEVVFE